VQAVEYGGPLKEPFGVARVITFVGIFLIFSDTGPKNIFHIVTIRKF
jgi:hypothetical protein